MNRSNLWYGKVAQTKPIGRRYLFAIDKTVFIQKCVLVVPTLFGSGTNQATFRNVFDIDLDLLVGG